MYAASIFSSKSGQYSLISYGPEAPPVSLISQKCLPLKAYVFWSAVVTIASGLTSLQVLGVGFGDGVSGSTPGRPE